jgi:glycosyltransferase involved in cell wall biosynthesis
MIRAARPGSALVVIPALNEEQSIAGVIAECRRSVPGLPLLVIDDCSSDGTATAARAAGAPVLRMPHHLGLGGAVQAGYKLAFELGFDYVVRIDGDGQHDPSVIPDVLAALRRQGVEMVIASRYTSGGLNRNTRARGLGIRFFRWLLGLILGQKVTDPTSGFVGVGRPALELFSKVFPLEYPEIEALVVLQRKSFHFAEVPYTMRPRRAGRSSITAWKSLSYCIHVLLGVFVNILKYEGRRRRRRILHGPAA